MGVGVFFKNRYSAEDPAPQAAARALATRIRSYSSPEPPSIHMNVPNESSDHMRLSLHMPDENPHTRGRRTTTTSMHSRPPSQHLPSFSLIGALEFRSVVTALRRESNASALEVFQHTPFTSGHYSRRSGTPVTHHGSQSRSQDGGSVDLPQVHDSERNPWESALAQGQGSAPRDGSLSPPGARSSHRPSPLQLPPPPAGKTPVPSIHINGEDGEVLSPDTETSYVSTSEDTPPRPPTVKRERFRSAFTRTMRVLFPTLVCFTDKSFVGMVVALFAAPAVLALTLTLPVVITPQGDAKVLEKDSGATGRRLDGGPAQGQLIDYEEQGAEWTLVAEDIIEEEMHGMKFNKWLMVAQCVFGPLFCAAILLSETEQFPIYATVIGIVGTVTAVLVLIFADDGNNPAARIVRCSMGFFVAIVWIMAIADEVVQVLQVRDGLRLFIGTLY